MWYYRFRDSAPFDSRVIKGHMIKKKEWTAIEIQTDFGAFKRFMESRNEPVDLMDTVSKPKKKTRQKKETSVEKNTATKSSRGRKKEGV